MPLQPGTAGEPSDQYDIGRVIDSMRVTINHLIHENQMLRRTIGDQDASYERLKAELERITADNRHLREEKSIIWANLVAEFPTQQASAGDGL